MTTIRFSRLRGALARENEAYSDADRPNARRSASMAWAAQAVLVLIFVSFAPPDARDPVLGWLAAAVVIVGSGTVARLLFRHPGSIGDDVLFGLGFLAVASLALLQWMAGGHGAPYIELTLVWIIVTAASHPAGRVAAFFAFTAAAAFAALSDSWDSESREELIGKTLVWGVLTAVVVERVARFRRQRIGLQRREDVAHTLALSDPLTGLGNRRGFEHALEALKEQTDLTGRVHTLALGDLDGFKAINDRFGHAYGDNCLRATADVVRASLRDSDGAYRWGGDELALLLPGSDAKAAAAVCNRIAEALAREVELPDGSSLSITFGIAELSEGTNPNALLDRADVELMAKKIERANA